jgi:hypothetical protein
MKIIIMILLKKVKIILKGLKESKLSDRTLFQICIIMYLLVMKIMSNIKKIF